MLLSTLLLGLLVLQVWNLIEYVGGRESDAVDPVELARQQYARGEIGDDDYERLQSDRTRAR